MDLKHAAAELLDDHDWAERSEYWLNYQKPTRGAPKKFKYREPLILCGHGVNIRVDHNTLLVRNGFTHYPQKVEQFRFFPGDANLPDRIILLDGSGGLTFDALNWMSDQLIEFVRLDWRGETTNVGTNTGYSGDRRLIAKQLAMKGTKTEVAIARDLIANKITASIETLKAVIPPSDVRQVALTRLAEKYRQIKTAKGTPTISQILGIEGACAAAYFIAWHGLPIKWSGFKRKPVPDNWFQIIARNMSWRNKTQNARHPVNAMLNYGYGILANQVRTQVIAAGLDPTIGIIHGTYRNRIPLVYDLMEPLRPTVDRAVLDFALSHTFTPGDFTINQWGGCRLNPQLAKVVASRLATVSAEGSVKDFLRPLQ